MAQGREFPCAVVGATAGLHANQARLQLREEGQKLRPPQGFVENDFLGGCDPMNLEHVLSQINADCGNLREVASLEADLDTCIMAHCDTG